MRSLVFVILLSPLLKFVVSGSVRVVGLPGAVRCNDAHFTARQVQRAAKSACTVRKRSLNLRKGVSKATWRKLNGIAQSCGKVLRKTCPSHLDIFPSPYPGDFFDPDGGPYITWHMTKLSNRIIKNAGKYRVVARFDGKFCKPAGVIVIERGKPTYRCQDTTKEYDDLDMDSDSLFSKSPGSHSGPIYHWPQYFSHRSPRSGTSTPYQASPRIGTPASSDQAWYSATEENPDSPLSEFFCDSPERDIRSPSQFYQDNAKIPLGLFLDPTFCHRSLDSRFSQGSEINMESPSRLSKKPSRHYNSHNLDPIDSNADIPIENDSDAHAIAMNEFNSLCCSLGSLPTIIETSEIDEIPETSHSEKLGQRPRYYENLTNRRKSKKNSISWL
ncbi:hypothetical protein K3495_g11226 [Podosphaera aphanis]|nr:hypothetical protein K3495_g11226 [Podosphaera aphanis]